MIGAEAVACAIRDAGVERLFLFPGGTIAPTLNAWIDLGGEYVVTRHEQGAGYAALATARLSGQPGVVMVTSGPGVTNLITVIADAWYDSTPLVAITGQVGTADLQGREGVRQRGFQEVPTADIVRSISKACLRPMRPANAGAAIHRAFEIAIDGRPGPVVVDLPMDVQREEIYAPEAAFVNADQLPKACLAPLDPLQLERLSIELSGAVRPVFLAGRGALQADAMTMLRALAERLQIPVATSLLGVGAFPGDHPLSLGFIGHTGSGFANRAVHECDLLVALGARLDVRQTGNRTEAFVPNGKVVRVDIDLAEMSQSRVTVDLALHADVRSVLESLQKEEMEFDKDAREGWLTQIASWRRRMPMDEYPAGAGCHPAKLLATLNRLTANEELVVATGVGHHQQWTARHMAFDAPRRTLLTSGGHGAMGYDLPSAVGAAFGRPEARVLCVVGDGSFQLNMQEMGTIAEYELPIKILVLDNQRLAMVSQFQNITFGADPSTGDRAAFPFAKFAELYGIRAFSLANENDPVEDTLRRFLAVNGPALLHVAVDPIADVSPMLLGGQTMNAMWTWNG